MSVWDDDMREVCEELDELFGEPVTIGDVQESTTMRLWNRSAQTVETETGHLRIITAWATVSRASMAERITRGSVLVDKDAMQWTVRGLTTETPASRTYEIYRKD